MRKQIYTSYIPSSKQHQKEFQWTCWFSEKPSLLYGSDDSEFGIGGYNLTSGQVWRFELPVDCRLWTSLNSLKFLSCIITIWVDMLASSIDKESCILCQTDSSTASGWLRKSNFSDKKDELVQLTTACQLANILIKTESCLYNQWFSGEENKVSDSLSCDFHLPPRVLSNLLKLSVPDQVPFGLEISPLPADFSSLLTLLLQNQPQKDPWLKAPKRSKLALGLATNSTWITGWPLPQLLQPRT